MTISILKILLVLVILSVMIILLVTINHFFAHGFETDDDEIEELRREVSDNRDVITDKSSFRDLVEVERPVRKDKNAF